jgi:outer membrane immunogenic protein
MRFKISGAAAVLLASMAPAFAQAPPMMVMGDAWQGFYVGANLGGAHDDSSYSTSPSGCFLTGCGIGGTAANPARSFSGSLNNGGFLGGVQAGYNWHVAPAWLLGVEADFDGGGAGSGSNTKVATLTAPLGGTATYSLNHSEHFLGTVRGRLGFLTSPNLLLYGTGGFAYGEINAGSSIAFSSTGGVGGADSYSGKASSVKDGWTAGGGFEYAINPAWTVGGQYLFVSLSSSGINEKFTGAVNAVAPAIPSYRSSISNDEHVFRLMLNYHFNPPPPPPAPMAAPAPPPPAPKVFIVFFDWDRDAITPEGHAIIQQAADAYKMGAPVQIQITGYTDRSGSPGYNQRLSERRANNVAKAMAALGVPPTQMAVSGRGENDNRVPTADGVREPQNRRVEIVSP